MANQEFSNAIKMTRLNGMRQRLREATARLEQQKLAASLLDAAHQQQRWGNEHDAGKEPADWHSSICVG